MSNLPIQGQIPAGGVAVVAVGNRDIPYTATLTSTAGNRQIAYSTNRMATPAVAATPDTSSVGMINFAFLAPVTHIQFTGNPNDAYEVL